MKVLKYSVSFVIASTQISGTWAATSPGGGRSSGISSGGGGGSRVTPSAPSSSRSGAPSGGGYSDGGYSGRGTSPQSGGSYRPTAPLGNGGSGAPAGSAVAPLGSTGNPYRSGPYNYSAPLGTRSGAPGGTGYGIGTGYTALPHVQSPAGNRVRNALVAGGILGAAMVALGSSSTGSWATSAAATAAASRQQQPKIADSPSTAQYAAQVRSAPYRPAYASSASQSSSDGYLAPTVTNMVLNPIYFWVPFNVWHSNLTANSAPSLTYSPAYTPGFAPEGAPGPSLAAPSAPNTPNLADDPSFTNDKYTAGEVGASEINLLPTWMQSALRLMHNHQRTVRPTLPKISLLDQTIREWEQAAAPLLTDRAGQRARLKEVESALNAETEIAVAREVNRRLDLTLRSQKILLDSEKSEIEALLKRREKSAAEVTELTNKLAAERKASYCLSWLSWFCSQTSPTTEAYYQMAKSDLESEDTRIRVHADFALRLQNQINSLTGDVSAGAARLLALETAFLPKRDELRSERDELIRKERVTDRQLEGLEGFIHFDFLTAVAPSAELTACAQDLYVYKFADLVGPKKSPLFADVWPDEVLPIGGNLVVCAKQGAVSSVHIFVDHQETFRSVVTVDDSKSVARIVILDSEGQTQEEHRWWSAKPGLLRYGLTFRHGSSQIDSIYADIPESK